MTEIKYEITPYIQEVIDKMKDGWVLKYDIYARPAPDTYLKKGKMVESVSNWTLTVLWGNDLVKGNKKFPVVTYKLK